VGNLVHDGVSLFFGWTPYDYLGEKQPATSAETKLAVVTMRAFGERANLATVSHPTEFPFRSEEFQHQPLGEIFKGMEFRVPVRIVELVVHRSFSFHRGALGTSLLRGRVVAFQKVFQTRFRNQHAGSDSTRDKLPRSEQTLDRPHGHVQVGSGLLRSP
jgi:hypothetical protein